jgi:hypothetical protein
MFLKLAHGSKFAVGQCTYTARLLYWPAVDLSGDSTIDNGLMKKPGNFLCVSLSVCHISAIEVSDPVSLNAM